MNTMDSDELKERQRIVALHKLEILDSPFETIFDCITKIANDVCETPIALISFIDEKRSWFKSNIGMDGVLHTDREISLCNHTIQNEELLEIPDATQDERFWDNPLVISEPNIRFYCGVPIKLPMGENIGSICVVDTKPNYLNHSQRKTLQGLAKLISKLLVAREVNLRQHRKNKN